MGYEKCLVNIELDSEKVLSKFGSLHESFMEWIGKREDGLSIPTINIINYIVACYDKDSPVVNEFRKRWAQKKREAARISGLLTLKGSSLSDVETVLYGKNPIIDKITVRYLALLFDRDFLMYAIYNEILINQSEQLLKFNYDKPGDVLKAKQNIELVQEDIRVLEEKIFSGGDVRALQNILQEEAHKFMVSELRPESLVTRKEEGKPVVDIKPYGDNYKIEDLKFYGD